jgi:hypothetical protein
MVLAPPYRSCHKPSETSTTNDLFAISDAENIRPMSGCVPAKVTKLGRMDVARTGSGSSVVRSSIPADAYGSRASKLFDRARHAFTIGDAGVIETCTPVLLPWLGCCWTTTTLSAEG